MRALPRVSSWKSEGTKATRERRAYFERLPDLLPVPGEKLDALHRRFPNEKSEPATFVRHFEDAAHVIAAAASLPPLADHADVRALAGDMLAKKQLAALPSSMDPAFEPAAGPRWEAIRGAHAAIGQMFWGPRIPLDEACARIREWTAMLFT